MSSYYEDDRRRTATRDRRRESDYYDDEVYNNTRDNQRSTTTALVKRRNDSPDSVEEVRRDFSPGGGGYYRETITRKSGVRPAGRARSYDNDRSYEDDRSTYVSSKRDSYRRGGGTAVAARYDDDRRSSRGARRNNYSSSSSRSSTPPKKRDRRKSMPEEAFEALGLGGVVAALTGKKNRDRSSSSERSRGDGRRSRSKSHGREQLIQAFKAAALAGAGAAFTARHEEGGWQGEKGKRVLTAALTAGGANGLINQYKDPEKHKLRDTIGSAVVGLAANRLVNGPADEEVGQDGRRTGRSQSRSRVGDLAAGGAIGAGVKKLTDSFRSRSQSRGRNSRSPSYDSRDGSPPRRQRSRSKRGSIARSLSRVGLTGVANRVDPDGASERERSRSRGPSRRRSRSRGRYSSDDDDSYYDDRRRGTYQPPQSNVYGDNREVRSQSSRPRSLSRSRSVGGPGDGQLIPRPHSVSGGHHDSDNESMEEYERRRIRTPPPGYTLTYEPQHTGDPETDSSNDLGSSSEDEQEHKKGRKSMLIAGGLATVATIHAGKSIHDTMEKRQARKKAVEEGKLSKEEAKKHKTKDRLQDLASVGLAGLGVKGAYGEWKEMKEKQEEWKETKDKVLRHRRKRAARRMKARLAGAGGGAYSSSAPTLSDPFYGNDGYNAHGQQQVYHGNQGPYMSGSRNQGGDANVPQYYDGNPYAYAAGQGAGAGGGHGYQDQGYGYGRGQGEGYVDGNHVNHNGYDNSPSYTNYPPPPQPAQGGTGFPPPPMGGPSPLNGGR